MKTSKATRQEIEMQRIRTEIWKTVVVCLKAGKIDKAREFAADLARHEAMMGVAPTPVTIL